METKIRNIIVATKYAHYREGEWRCEEGQLEKLTLDLPCHLLTCNKSQKRIDKRKRDNSYPYELRSVVEEMLQQENVYKSGKMMCDGNEGNHGYCLGSLHYQIGIVYEQA